jgi:uncharacterized membrane protein
MNLIFLTGVLVGAVGFFMALIFAGLYHDYRFYRESYKYSRMHALRKALKELRDFKLFTF